MSRPVRACSLCDSPHWGRGYCKLHYHRWRRTGDPHQVRPRGSRQRGPDGPGWRGDAVGYYGAHRRVRLERGPASAHLCVDCGKRPARQWSYDHNDPNERPRVRDSTGRVISGPFSTNPAMYSPRCTGCHRRLDNRERREHCAA